MNDYIKQADEVRIGDILEVTEHPEYGVISRGRVGERVRVTEIMGPYNLVIEPLDPNSKITRRGPHVNWFRKAQPEKPRYWVKVYGPLIGGNHVFADGYDHYLVEQPTDVFLENDCVIIFAAPSKHGDRDVLAYSVTYLPGQATKVVMGIVTPKED